jgi:hypothetical protein
MSPSIQISRFEAMVGNDENRHSGFTYGCRDSAEIFMQFRSVLGGGDALPLFSIFREKVIVRINEQ